MLKFLSVFCFTFLAVVSGAVCAEAGTACPPVAVQPTPEAVQAGMRNARDHGFLWRISRDGRTSYLYGTLHVAKPEWMYPGPRVMQALRATDTVALELDVMDADIRGRLAAGMAALPSVPLPDHLIKRLRKQADAVCVSYETLAGLTPELQIVTLTVMMARWEGLDASYGIDSVLAGIGHGAKLNVVSLETPEAQLKMLQMENVQESIVSVQDGLAELETGGARTLLKRIAQVWADADHAALERYGEWCDCLDTQGAREMMKRLLDDRNPNMADGIDALHTGGRRVFAAVGSLHMFGSSGLPAQMAKRGYRVERIDFKSQ